MINGAKLKFVFLSNYYDIMVTSTGCHSVLKSSKLDIERYQIM